MPSSQESGGYVLLAVCGGIAAYKACEVLRALQRAGRDVRVVMTEDATRFVGTVTFEALSSTRRGHLALRQPRDPIASAWRRGRTSRSWFPPPPT